MMLVSLIIPFPPDACCLPPNKAWLAAEGRRAPRKPKGVEAGDTAKRVSAVVIRKRGREASPASPVVSPGMFETCSSTDTT